MGTKILDNRELIDLQPAHGLWQLYDPHKAPFRFQSKSLPAAKQWQTETRPALTQTLGFQSLPYAPLSPEKIETVDREKYVREKILIRTSENSMMPGNY
jgi:hypothetical protein